MLTKNDVIQGAGYLGKNGITWDQANSTGMPPDRKVNKAEELTYISTNIVPTYISYNLYNLYII
jgi:hypothetical protein